MSFMGNGGSKPAARPAPPATLSTKKAQKAAEDAAFSDEAKSQVKGLALGLIAPGAGAALDAAGVGQKFDDYALLSDEEKASLSDEERDKMEQKAAQKKRAEQQKKKPARNGALGTAAAVAEGVGAKSTKGSADSSAPKKSTNPGAAGPRQSSATPSARQRTMAGISPEQTSAAAGSPKARPHKQKAAQEGGRLASFRIFDDGSTTTKGKAEEETQRKRTVAGAAAAAGGLGMVVLTIILVSVLMTVTVVTASVGGGTVNQVINAQAVSSTCTPLTPTSVAGQQQQANAAATAKQAMRDANATKIFGVAKGLGLNEKAGTIAMATTLVEAGGLNLASKKRPESIPLTVEGIANGDLDSVGLFQQRDAWGSIAERMDPAKSAYMFFTGGKAGQRGVIDFPWQQWEEGYTAQKVQVSAFPLKYTQRVTEARDYINRLWAAAPVITVTDVANGYKGGAADSGTTSGDDETSSGMPCSDLPASGVNPDGTTFTPMPGTPTGKYKGGMSTVGLQCPAGSKDQGIFAGGSQKVPIHICYFEGTQLDASLMANWMAMKRTAAAAGVLLGGGGFRSYDRQVELYNQNCSRGSCSPPTAKPGSSQHEFGLAVDITYGGGAQVIRVKQGRGVKEFAWLQANAVNFGFYNLPSENWHWSSSGN